MMMTHRLAGWVGGLATALAFGATASAGTIGPNFCLSGSTATNCLVQLDMLNTPGSSFTYAPSGYVTGSIQILSSNELQVQFNANTINGVTYNLGDLFLNVVDPSQATVSNITFTAAGNKTPSYTVNAYANGPITNGSTSGFQADGWGNFDVQLQDHNGSPYAVSQLTFDVTWTGAGAPTFSDLLNDQVLVLNGTGNTKGQNDGGQSAAGHVYASDGNTYYAAWPGTCDQGVGVGCSTSNVPEPASLALLGSGLVGLGLIGWRRRRAVV